MRPPGADTVLVRHGELGTKTPRVQARMEGQLAANIRDRLALNDLPGDVTRERGRLFISATEEAITRTATIAAGTFGVVSASPARTTEPRFPAIKTALAETARATYEGGTFAVRARRAGPADAHDFTSADLEREGGAAVWEAVEASFQPEVDLEAPDVELFVECREDRAYVFLELVDGPGGFPAGTQGRVVSLVSGGTDSPVATWELYRRGCEVVPVYFDFEEYGGADHRARAVRAVRQLATYAPGQTEPLYVVPIGEAVDRLLADADTYRMLVLRRLMFRIAAAIAAEEGAHAIGTGESLGQKSSQTGPNLAATSQSITRPVHRPLLNVDKPAIIEQAKTIGTHDAAQIPAGCNRIAPDNPATAATPGDVAAAEPAAFQTDIQRFLAGAERIDIEPAPPVPAAGQPV